MDKDVKEYIKKHIDVRPRKKLAQMVDISVTSLYRIMHELGFESGDYAFIPKPNAVRDARITELYVNHTTSEIAEITGYHQTTIARAVQRLHLVHNQETLERAKAKRIANLKRANDKEVINKRNAKRKKTQRLEKFRFCAGLPQKTKMKFGAMPRKHYMAKYHLMQKYGYFAFDGEPYVIGYDSKTIRAKEKYYSTKYGFTFERFED